MRFLVAVALAASLAPAFAVADDGAPSRYVALLNRSPDSVVAVAIAPRGGDAFRDVTLATPVRGGGGSATLSIATRDCVHDVRVGFRDGRSRVFHDVDLCGKPRLAIERSPRGAMLPGEALASNTSR